MSGEPNAKRIRGWTLDKEKHDALHVPQASKEFGDQSALGTKLLHLWAAGNLSATACRELAHLAIMDGATHPELYTLANCGQAGANKGNVHRDILRAFCHQVHLSNSFEIEVPCRDPKTSKTEKEMAAVFLPHLLFSSMSTYEEFDQWFATDKVESFWAAIEASGDERLTNHPMKSHDDWRTNTIPVFIHGDGVEYQDRDSMLVFSWGAILNVSASQDSSIMIAGWPKSCTCKDEEDDTWLPIIKWVAWSFAALLEGKCPAADPDGLAFGPESPFYNLAGTPIHPKWRVCVWALQGDHEYFSNTLHLPHWQNAKMCWECDCDTAVPSKSWRNIRPGEQDWSYVSVQQAFARPISNHHFFTIPGVSSKSIFCDSLHVLFTKGVLAHLLGSVLHLICWIAGPGRQSALPSERLALVFSEVQAYYKSHLSTTRLTNLRVSMFTKEDKPHQTYAFFNGKASESKYFLPALLHVAKLTLDSTSALHAHVIGAMETIHGLVRVFDTAGIVLTAPEFQCAKNLVCEFFTHYDCCNAWAVGEGRLLFHIVPKFHMLWHLVLASKHLNPRMTWCFRSEDYVGKISHVANSVSMGVKSTRISQKVALKYRHMLHLRLTRGDYNDDSD